MSGAAIAVSEGVRDSERIRLFLNLTVIYIMSSARDVALARILLKTLVET